MVHIKIRVIFTIKIHFASLFKIRFAFLQATKIYLSRDSVRVTLDTQRFKNTTKIYLSRDSVRVTLDTQGFKNTISMNDLLRVSPHFFRYSTLRLEFN
jgi:capsular polysaccharide biosynthesis protein